LKGWEKNVKEGRFMKTLFAGLMLAVVGLAIPASAQAIAEHYRLNIQRQSLDGALKEFAGQTGLQVARFSDAVRGDVVVGPLSGTYSVDKALTALLNDQGLAYKLINERTIAIVKRGAQASGTPTSRLEIVPDSATPSDSNAVYSNASSILLAQNTATATDVGAAGPAPGTSAAGEGLAEIVVTGSLISRTNYGTDSPSVLIGTDAIAATGQVTVDRALGEMPQFSAAQGISETGDAQAETGYRGGQAYGDLRGLGPNRALVLLDGRRMQSSNPDGSIDLNTVPMAMIENVEVITGGASAAYGSDAMAGVINFKLRKDFEGAEVDLQHGATTHGDGASNRVAVLLGSNFADHRGNAVVSLEYAGRDPVYGRDRPFFSNVRAFAFPQEGIVQPSSNAPTIAAVNGVLAGYPGTTPLPGTGTYPGAIGVNTDGTIFTDKFSTPVQNYRGAGAPLVRLTNGGKQVSTILSQFFVLQVPLEKYNMFGRATYKINDDVSMYTQTMFTHYTARDVTSPANATSSPKLLNIPTSNPFVQGNPDLLAILNSRAQPTASFNYAKQLVELGNRAETYNHDVFQIITGLKGDVPGHDLTWDVYVSYGRDSFLNIQHNDGSISSYKALLNGTANYHGTAGACTGYGNYDPFGLHGMSAACLEFVRRTNHNSDTITQKEAQGTLQGKLLPLPAGDLRFAVGADYRGFGFDYVPDSSLVIGDGNGYGSISPAGGASTVREAFGELLIPLLSKLPMAEDLSLNLGYRYSEYARIGGVSTYKADLSWEPIRSLQVRGGYQKAIRAPSVGELFAPQSQSTQAFNGDPCDATGAFRTGANAAKVVALCQAQGLPASLLAGYAYGSPSVNTLAGGNPDLKQETADTYSIGAVWRSPFEHAMARNLSASIDFFNIKISDAVGSISQADVVDRCFNRDGTSNPGYSASNFYCNLITRDTSSGNISLVKALSLNLATYKTSGIDLQLDWSFALSDLGLPDGAGRIRLNSSSTYTQSFDVGSLPGSPVINYAGSIGNQALSNDLAHPRWKAVTSLSYAVGPAAIGGHWRYISAMKYFAKITAPTDTTPDVPAYSYFDVDAHWKISKTELSAGITNVADKQPPAIAGASLNTDAGTYDIIGRQYYVSIKQKF
jgi:outer membrane receptor protein involved in Fe transport